MLSELLHEVMKDGVFKRCANTVLKTPALLGSGKFIQTKKTARISAEIQAKKHSKTS